MYNFVLIILLALCWQITISNTRTANYWKLNLDSGIIRSVQLNAEKELQNAAAASLTATTADKNAQQQQEHHHHQHHQQQQQKQQQQQQTHNEQFKLESKENIYAQDELFYIIASTLTETTGSWVRRQALLFTPRFNESQLTREQEEDEEAATAAEEAATKQQQLEPMRIQRANGRKKNATNAQTAEERLSCGKPVNFTYYDYLIGVGQRINHPMVPDAEVAYVFMDKRTVKNEHALKNFDVIALEKRLKHKQRTHSPSVFLYSQIGNYYRLVGDATQAIECFRRALAMAPTNAEVILDLARVLYSLQYLDDAIHLTRRSLELTPQGPEAWQHYYTLGKIFKAYGHHQDSLAHFRHALELYPFYEPIHKALREIEEQQTAPIHFFTLVIILFLVVAVLIVVLAMYGHDDDSGDEESGSDDDLHLQTKHNRNDFKSQQNRKSTPLRPLHRGFALTKRSFHGIRY